ncbi:hypothetical protein FNJ20_23790 [Salmonella enterica subsp. salamae]|nr:hypothetical protein [Salmonella enterica subsp. salamae]
MILFPMAKESASLPYSFPRELFSTLFLMKKLLHKGIPYLDTKGMPWLKFSYPSDPLLVT